MEIKLDRLTLENFKGVRSFTLEVNGNSARVHGQNGAGKTTLMDGFLWLLFGKDSTGRADFAVKTLDNQGQELHNLCHSVEAVLSIDGRALTLKKVLKEKWVKRRGSAKATFTGHTTDFSIDSVPVQEKEWKARIQAIIQEDTFKLLTNPAHFNSLHWQRRREILLQVCGDVPDGDVIASDRDLRDLPEILGDRSLEDHRKVLAAKKKEINDRLKEIPARIDELTKSLVDVSAYDVSAIQARIKGLAEQIQDAKSDPGNATLRKQRAELGAQLAEAQATLDRLRRHAEKVWDDRIADLEDDHRKKERELQGALSDILIIDLVIEHNEREMDRLRKEFVEEQDIGFEPARSCPACGQPLPADQIGAAVEKFNLGKAGKLSTIQQQGLKLRAANEERREYKTKLETLRGDLEAAVKYLERKIADAKDARAIVLADVGKSEIKYIQAVQAEILTLDDKIKTFAPPDTSAMEAEKAAEEKKLAEIEAAKKTQARITELSEEEKKLAGEYEELERQTFLLEKFVVAKVGLLEGKINSKFALARFKLFEQQVNGGIAETCVTLFEGVPFGAGLNTGAEINVGLDIIRTLSRHYGIKAPVWIDHAESVLEILPLETQTIKLVVDDCPLEVRQ